MNTLKQLLLYYLQGLRWLSVLKKTEKGANAYPFSASDDNTPRITHWS
jgi:hypothetical protein